MYARPIVWAERLPSWCWACSGKNLFHLEINLFGCPVAAFALLIVSSVCLSHLSLSFMVIPKYTFFHSMDWRSVGFSSCSTSCSRYSLGCMSMPFGHFSRVLFLGFICDVICLLSCQHSWHFRGFRRVHRDQFRRIVHLFGVVLTTLVPDCVWLFWSSLWRSSFWCRIAWVASLPWWGRSCPPGR